MEIVNVNRHKGWQQGLKIALVSLVSFFGTAFTIMAYHNDIGIRDVFAELYLIVMGTESDGFTVLEVFYSIGLAYRRPEDYKRSDADRGGYAQL